MLIPQAGENPCFMYHTSMPFKNKTLLTDLQALMLFSAKDLWTLVKTVGANAWQM